MTARQKVLPARLPREVYRALEDIVGPDYITEDRAVLETYSKCSVDGPGFLKKHARDPSNIPACVVLPATTEEVQAICRVASRYKVRMNPFTNGQFFLAAQTTGDPTICIHVSRMNWISIDEDNLSARLGAYADYGQLQAEAMKKGLWNGGTPLATTLCKLSSQSTCVGIWQTDHKYGTLSRNIVNIQVVMPDGEILKTGSTTTAGVQDFFEYGPGPDLLAVIRGSIGTTGIITEITVKLHPWPGGEELPEPEAGRPSIPTYDDARYDTPPLPQRHKLLWVEFPDMATELKALRAIALSGIGIGLNATGVYNAYYCSPTQTTTLKRLEQHFFPPFNCYVIIQGMVSTQQMVYEEMVMREIVAEVGGTFLSQAYKPEVLEALAPWNLDCIRHSTGFRMNRYNYAGSMVPGGSLEEIAYKTQQVWGNVLKTVGGETYITDRGGVEDTPFLYSINKGGRLWLAEVDVYPNPMDPAALAKGNAMILSGTVNLFAQKIGLAPTGIGVSFEPLTSFFPEQGPNAHHFFRTLRQVFDPQGLCAPGRQVFSREEYEQFPDAVLAALNKLRQIHGMPPVEKNNRRSHSDADTQTSQISSGNGTLATMLGPNRVRDDAPTLEHFSRDQSFAPARRPDVVIYAETVEEIQAVVRYANQHRVPITPLSSGLNFHGAAVPDHGGILLNLSRMKKIPLIDEKNLFVAVEPGVTYGQLQEYLLARGYRVMMPFGVPPGRSVLTSYLERDPVMAAASFEYGNALIMDTEIILPTGELLRTGVWSTADKPGGFMGPVRHLLYRLWTGAQGTLGIMTKMCIQIHPLIREKKIFFLTFHNLSDALGPLASIQRREIGLECFLLNGFNLAAMLTDDWEVPASFPTPRTQSNLFVRLKAALPPWTMVIVLQGGPRHPEEKIAYEEEALREECEHLNIHLRESIPGVPGLARVMAAEILRPWRVLKKFNYRGSVHDLNFAAPLKNVALMESIIKETCLSNGYSPADLGGYLLPVERGRAVHCEVDLHCDIANRSEAETVKQVRLTASEALMNRGAYFSRPYGPWAEMMYRRSGSYTRKLIEIKSEVDPNHIMNPGKLCF